MLSCFPDLKEYPEIDTKLKQNHTFVYNSRIIKRSSFSSIFAINDFYIINPTSMGFPLDLIYIKRPRSSYITLFLKNTFVPASFALIIVAASTERK